MNRDMLTGLIIGLLGGCIVGYLLGASHIFESSHAPVPAAAAPAAALPIPGAMNQLDAQQRILSAEAAVAADPKNVQAWIALGNDYFDTHQAQKSVDAYSKGLALAPAMPAAPDVLTDQGVMYRELKSFDKAVANFKQANKLNPKHLHSLFNLGIVYAQDLNNPTAALQAWNKIIEVDPTSAQADQARQAIASLKGGPAKMMP